MSFAALARRTENAPPGRTSAAARLRIGAMNDALEQEADRVARKAIAMPQWSFSAMRIDHRADKRPNASSAGALKLTQRAPVALQRKEAPKKDDPKLLNDFAAKFPNAVKLIKESPAAMELVKEAAQGGAEFGGYAEDGPGKDEEGSRPYTRGHAVYISKASDGLPAMRDFLFELNNAVRAPKFIEINKAAAKGKKTDDAAAEQYAYRTTELEVEGMLRLGKIWFEMKAAKGKEAKSWDKYDEYFFLAEYQAFKDKKKTKDDIVRETLNRKYEGGPLTGKTPRQLYKERYKELAGD